MGCVASDVADESITSQTNSRVAFVSRERTPTLPAAVAKMEWVEETDEAFTVNQTMDIHETVGLQ